MKIRSATLRGSLAALATVLGIAVLAAPAAAATDFGSDCASNEIEAPGAISVSSHGADNPLPFAAPVSGVITSWRTSTEVSLPPEAVALVAPRLLLLRPGGDPNHFTLVGEAVATSLDAGRNVFPTRLPVQAGDRLGTSGGVAQLICKTSDPADVIIGNSSEEPPSGGVYDFDASLGERMVPVAATIEPDVDHDGFGDETQDACPQSAAYQIPCPVVKISSTAYAGGKKVKVYVATSLSAPVSVSGSVALGKGKTAALTATAQPVGPGQVATFVLTLPQSVLKQLQATPPKKKLAVSVTATATNVNGSISSSATAAKLPGQKKPAPKHQ